MRSLQRLQHQRPLAPREVTHVQKSEGSTIAKRQAGVRRKRAVRVFTMALVIAAGVLVIHRLLTSRVVVQGLVKTDLVVVRAPARVRVEQLFVTAGQGCETGEVLMQLRAVDADADRKVLELDVARAANKLQIVAAGGDIGSSDLNRRKEMLSDARVQLQIAEAAARQASAEWQALVRQRARTEIELKQARLQADQEVVRMTARAQELEAAAESVGATRVLKELEAEQGEDLHADGLVSERERISSEVGSRIAQQQWQGASVALEAAKSELEHAATMDGLEDERSLAVLSELDARVAAAQRALELELARRELWADVARERGALLPEDPTSPKQLRDLELRLLQIELESAQASLDAFDARVGNTVIKATLTGVVDSVLVREGSIVEEGEVLLRYLDPRGVHVEGYAEPGGDNYLAFGAECTIIPEARARSIKGSVSAISSSWDPCPLPLLSDGMPETNPRLSFRVEPQERGERSLLRPGMRVRIVFEQ